MEMGKLCSFASSREREGHGSTEEEEEEEFKVLTTVRSRYNEILIVETTESRFLLLDSTHNVHSILNKGRKWTGSYWDEFASLPAIVPRGPIAILGLGGGTSAHLILDSWPSLKLEGWEIDELLIDKAREYLGLCNLERCNQVGGVLCVHVGDALSPSATVPGGFAGIVVDLFSDGKILTQLQEVATWLELNNRLMCHGRIMVNCGGVHAETTDPSNVAAHAKLSQKGDLWIQNSTIKAMCSAFPGNLSWKKEAGGENYLALTGPMPDLDLWSNLVPDHLKLNVKQWKPCMLKSLMA
ncbi:hypothetical protein Scep_003040 [Stephania cephalantha]|uniref:Spermidine synthase n=1 Tax=Stephania cephalantha TaxID=152367 RepID=A0AAP0LF38_9MAGN